MGAIQMKHQLFKLFESIAYYVECKYFCMRDGHKFSSPIPAFIEIMDMKKISWFNQNVLLDFWNNWEVNYRKCLSTSYSTIFEKEILPKLNL
jgi:hypothetical protein